MANKNKIRYPLNDKQKNNNNDREEKKKRNLSNSIQIAIYR